MEQVTFVNAAWWRGTGITKLLTKGAVVTIFSRISLKVYKDRNGEPTGTINCFVKEIKLQHKKSAQPAPSAANLTDLLDDLQF